MFPKEDYSVRSTAAGPASTASTLMSERDKSNFAESYRTGCFVLSEQNLNHQQ